MATRRAPAAAPAAAPVTPAAPVTAQSRLAALSKKAGAKPAAATQAKPEITFTDPAIAEVMDKWAGAKPLFDIFKTAADNSLGELKGESFTRYTQSLWATKSKPKNPEISTLKDGRQYHRAIFQVVQTFKVEMPFSDTEDPNDTAVNTLRSVAQLDEADAVNLVKNELDFTPDLDVRFKECMEGHRVDGTWVEPTALEKAAGNTLYNYLMGISANFLTPEETEVIVISKPNVRVKSGFVERVCTYVHSLEQLRAVLSVIKPQKRMSGLKYAQTENEEGKRQFLVAAAAEIIGTADLTVSSDD
jgi:hypothetical protein